MLTTQHIPRVTNQIADVESRVTGDHLNWKLSEAFSETRSPLEVDLSASCLFAQLDRFFSWKPDSLAEATNTFQHD